MRLTCHRTIRCAPGEREADVLRYARHRPALVQLRPELPRELERRDTIGLDNDGNLLYDGDSRLQPRRPARRPEPRRGSQRHDLGLLLGSWGQSGPSDLTGDGTTDGADLGLLLAAWGPCP